MFWFVIWVLGGWGEFLQVIFAGAKLLRLPGVGEGLRVSFGVAEAFCRAGCHSMGSALRGQCYQGGWPGHGAGVRDFLHGLRGGDVPVLHSLIGPGGPGGVDGEVVVLKPDVTGQVGRS